jgi:predicted O-linked N-acetylglucosamine transferase (SPINDLY family)
VPNAVLWLLRFPDLGENNLRELAKTWASNEVASRIIFTDVAPKAQHISRAQVCDLFLDTPECNAHTTAADVLWSGTPLLTLPRHKHKMCSRIAASILRAAVPQTREGKAKADSLIANDEDGYESRAIQLARGMRYTSADGHCEGELADIRKVLFGNRRKSELFNTKRWVRDLEDAYEEAWRRWVKGEGGDIDLKTIPAR